MKECLKFYINGKWVDPVTPKTLDVINPATEEVVGRISLGSAADVDKAVTAARAAFETFGRTSREERIALLEKVIGAYQARMGEMAETISLEMGAPMWLANAAQAPAAFVDGWIRDRGRSVGRRRVDQLHERRGLLDVAPFLSGRRNLDPAIDPPLAFLDDRKVDRLAGRRRHAHRQPELVEMRIGQRAAAPRDLVDRLGDGAAVADIGGPGELPHPDFDRPAGLRLRPHRQHAVGELHPHGGGRSAAAAMADAQRGAEIGACRRFVRICRHMRADDVRRAEDHRGSGRETDEFHFRNSVLH